MQLPQGQPTQSPEIGPEFGCLEHPEASYPGANHDCAAWPGTICFGLLSLVLFELGLPSLGTPTIKAPHQGVKIKEKMRQKIKAYYRRSTISTCKDQILKLMQRTLVCSRQLDRLIGPLEVCKVHPKPQGEHPQGGYPQGGNPQGGQHRTGGLGSASKGWAAPRLVTPMWSN